MVEKPKVSILIQCRSNSQRFPRKIFQTIGDKSLLEWAYHASREAAKLLTERGIEAHAAIICPKGDSAVEGFAEEKLIPYFSSFEDESDVLGRYVAAARHYRSTHVVRITADCWMTNPSLVAHAAEMMVQEKLDYVCNTAHRTFIEGLDVQAASMKGLLWFDRLQKEEREHPFKPIDENEIWRVMFTKDGLRYSEIMNPQAEWLRRTSIDTQEDLEKARHAYQRTEKARSKLG